MKTSTPTGIHLPKKHSLNRNFLAIEDNEEIEQEIQRRREEAINKSAEVRRKSIAAPLIAGLTASELTQHCKDCIKLSTENKINMKNAFSFLLIDAMAAMAKKSDSEINKNFQVASCTLDASVKIYGYRVDAVHTEAIKMAGGVLSKEVGGNEENVENNEENEDENEMKSKLKKKRRKKLTVVNPETLNAKSESDLLMDVIPHQSFLMHKNDGNDLLIKIPKFDDNSVLYINSDYECWPYNNKSSVSLKKFESYDLGSLKSMLQDVELSKSDHLCPLYWDFQFGKDHEEVEDTSDEEYSSPGKTNQFEFDLNASVEDVPMSDDCATPQKETQRNRLQVPAGGYDSDQEVNLQPIPEKKTRNIPLSDLKNRITLNQLEYSMFDEHVLKAWAGPSYWKVCPSRRMFEEGKENENTSKAIGSKSTRKARAKPATGLFDMEERLLAKCLASGDKTTLNKSTMLNWSPQNVTVPKDCMYKAKNFLSLFHFPNFFINMREEEEIDQVEVGDVGAPAEENEELEYCSNMSMPACQNDPDDEDDDNEQVEQEEIWDEKNMVAMPNRIEKIPVSTFKRKKNVDIKYLKKCLWGMLTVSGTQNHIKEPITFQNIMKNYTTTMPKSLTPSLSAPQIFNALLHLTNEKCLTLTQNQSDKSDFVVSQ